MRSGPGDGSQAVSRRSSAQSSARSSLAAAAGSAALAIEREAVTRTEAGCSPRRARGRRPGRPGPQLPAPGRSSVASARAGVRGGGSVAPTTAPMPDSPQSPNKRSARSATRAARRSNSGARVPGRRAGRRRPGSRSARGRRGRHPPPPPPPEGLQGVGRPTAGRRSPRPPPGRPPRPKASASIQTAPARKRRRSPEHRFACRRRSRSGRPRERRPRCARAPPIRGAEPLEAGQLKLDRDTGRTRPRDQRCAVGGDRLGRPLGDTFPRRRETLGPA